MSGRLVYTMNVSLDGYVETLDHGLDWTVVDDELHQWFADELRTVAVSLYGRRLYELMVAYWPTSDDDPAASPVTREFGAVWRATPRIVFSSTLDAAEWANRIEREDIVDALPRLRREFDGDMEVGGPTLAAPLVQRGLIDEYRMVVHPVILGAGTPYIPPLDQPHALRPTTMQRFASGAVYLAYEAVR